MFQYIFFVCSAMINITKEQSKELYPGIPLEMAIKLNLQRKLKSQIYNLQCVRRNDRVTKGRVAKKKKPIKQSCAKSDSPIPLDLSKNHFMELLKLKKSNLNKTKDFISEKSSSKIDVEKMDIDITQNDEVSKLEYIANEVIKEQAEFLKNKTNVGLYENRIEKNKISKNIFKEYDYKKLCPEFNSYLNIELVYDKKFIINFFKRYANRHTDQVIIKKCQNHFFYFKRTLNKILKIIDELKSELLKIFTGFSMKEVLDDHISCFENLVRYYQKLLSPYAHSKDNHLKLLYWYMRFSVEVHMLEDLFDLKKIRKGYYGPISPTPSYEKSFDKLFKDLGSYNRKIENLLKSVIKIDKFLDEFIIQFISKLSNKK